MLLFLLGLIVGAGSSFFCVYKLNKKLHQMHKDIKAPYTITLRK